MPTTVAFVFPGQGSQRLGMLDALPAVDGLGRLIDAAEALSDLELRTIAVLGPESELAETRVAQPLLYLADWAWARALMDRGVRPSAVAGHSLGELAALAVAGVFSVEAGLELVVERSKLMSAAALATPGSMAAVLGIDAAAVTEAVAGIEGVWIANDNAPGQVVLSGTESGIESASQRAAEAGARKVVPLKVAGAFHSPLMEPARAAFEELIRGAEFADATVPVYQNTDPMPATDATAIRERLVGQIASPVRWTETMQALVADGITMLVEAGPGAVLTGLAKRIDGVEAVSTETAGIDSVLEEVG